MKVFQRLGLITLLLWQTPIFAYDYSYNKSEDEGKVGAFYVGASAGYILGDAYNLCDDNDDITCTTWKAFVGYKPTDYMAFEAAHHNLMSGRADNGTKLQTNAISWAALGIMPVKDKVEAFGKIGFAAWEADVLGTSSGSDGTDLLLGVGAQMKFNENLGVRGEFEYISGDLDSTNFSAGVTYSTY